jgi:hypothetical protein
MAEGRAAPMPQSPPNPPQINHLFRKPRRVSVSLPQQVVNDLVEMADQQGRSLSNIAAFLLETRLREIQSDNRYHL